MCSMLTYMHQKPSGPGGQANFGFVLAALDASSCKDHGKQADVTMG